MIRDVRRAAHILPCKGGATLTVDLLTHEVTVACSAQRRDTFCFNCVSYAPYDSTLYAAVIADTARDHALGPLRDQLAPRSCDGSDANRLASLCVQCREYRTVVHGFPWTHSKHTFCAIVLRTLEDTLYLLSGTALSRVSVTLSALRKQSGNTTSVFDVLSGQELYAVTSLSAGVRCWSSAASESLTCATGMSVAQSILQALVADIEGDTRGAAGEMRVVVRGKEGSSTAHVFTLYPPGCDPVMPRDVAMSRVTVVTCIAEVGAGVVENRSAWVACQAGTGVPFSFPAARVYTGSQSQRRITSAGSLVNYQMLLASVSAEETRARAMILESALGFLLQLHATCTTATALHQQVTLAGTTVKRRERELQAREEEGRRREREVHRRRQVVMALEEEEQVARLALLLLAASSVRAALLAAAEEEVGLMELKLQEREAVLASREAALDKREVIIVQREATAEQSTRAAAFEVASLKAVKGALDVGVKDIVGALDDATEDLEAQESLMLRTVTRAQQLLQVAEAESGARVSALVERRATLSEMSLGKSRRTSISSVSPNSTSYIH